MLSYNSFIFMVVYITSWTLIHPAFFFPAAVYAYLSFRGELDGLYTMGPLYWITRRDARWFSIGIGTMHETNEPWRVGKGIYVAAFKRCFQIGLCRVQTLDETEGILSAVKGRYLELEPKEIGDWGVQEKAGRAKLTA